jgi:hypothetical protein
MVPATAGIATAPNKKQTTSADLTRFEPGMETPTYAALILSRSSIAGFVPVARFMEFVLVFLI